MNATSRAMLLAAEHRYMVTRYPNVPEKGILATAYNDKTANGLTRCVIDWIKFNGGHAERVANMGRPIKQFGGRMKWIPGSGRNGSADIHALISGRTVMVEIKIGRDQQSPAQIRYAADIIRAGGTYLIVRSFDEFIQQIMT